MPSLITIGRRFNGPPQSGNGGYVCGAMAAAIGADVRVRLKQPPPLETPLALVCTDAREWRLLNGEDVVATAVAATVVTDVPAPPSFDAAVEASHNYPSAEEHVLPHCFVCGPARAAGDGLRIFAGRVAGTNVVAGPWVPDASIAAHGEIKPAFIWAAVDCPGAFAVMTDKPMLLGELAVRVDRPPAVNERCVVIGWPIAAEGRKYRVGTALFGADRGLCAVGLATWIELKT